MVIQASAKRQIDGLLTDLAADDTVRREAAIARLIVIGPRAVERLVSFVSAPASSLAARIAGMRAIEGIGDVRALDAAIAAAQHANDLLAVAGIAVTRLFVKAGRGVEAVECLTSVVLDRARSDRVRTAALQALDDLDQVTVGPIREVLASDPRGTIRALVGAGTGEAQGIVSWNLAKSEGTLPDDPNVVRQAVADAGDTVDVTLLERLVACLRDREAQTPSADRRHWTVARAAVHAALARRSSRLALYDLRETLAGATTPLPVEFVAALSTVGDASCLEAIAAAYARTDEKAAGLDWWQRHLTNAFQSIVRRERLTRRHQVSRKIEKRWPEACRALWPARQ